MSDHVRIVEAILDDSGALSKLVVEQEDHKAVAVDLPQGGGASGVGDFITVNYNVASHDFADNMPLFPEGIQDTDWSRGDSLVFEDGEVNATSEGVYAAQLHWQLWRPATSMIGHVYLNGWWDSPGEVLDFRQKWVGSISSFFPQYPPLFDGEKNLHWKPVVTPDPDSMGVTTAWSFVLRAYKLV